MVNPGLRLVVTEDDGDELVGVEVEAEVLPGAVEEAEEEELLLEPPGP